MQNYSHLALFPHRLISLILVLKLVSDMAFTGTLIPIASRHGFIAHDRSRRNATKSSWRRAVLKSEVVSPVCWLTCENFLLLWKDIFHILYCSLWSELYDDDFNNQSWFVVMDVICRRTNIWNFALPAIMWAGLSGADLPKINRGLLYKSHPTSEMETRLFFSTPPRPFQWLTS